MQGFTPVTDNELDHSIEERSTGPWHSDPDHSIEEHSAGPWHSEPDHSIEERGTGSWHSEPDHSIEERSAGSWHSDPDHSIEERSTSSWHSEYETIAQGLCTTMTINNGQGGWIYAIKRRCHSHYPVTCSQLCSARSLADKDPKTRNYKWRSIGALHVYAPRPASAQSTVTNPFMGYKVLWHPHYHSAGGCGPNYCCCLASTR